MILGSLGESVQGTVNGKDPESIYRSRSLSSSTFDRNYSLIQTSVKSWKKSGCV